MQNSTNMSSSEILAPVRADMEQMAENLRNIVGNRHPLLLAAAEQIFGAGGKKLRPAIVFLVARATAELMGLRWVTLLSFTPLTLKAGKPRLQCCRAGRVSSGLARL